MFALVFFVISISVFPYNTVELTFIWHEGSLGENLIELAKEYTAETGVVVRGELAPWSEWHNRIAGDFAAKGGKYDLTIFDSQSMSEFASKNYVVLLNPFLDKSAQIKVSDFEPTALKQYAEYPEESGNLYALPVNQDAMGLAYRKDLFESPAEMEAFKKKYGTGLKAPRTYSELRDIAEFFTRPDQNLYGIALFGSPEYDAVTSSFNNILWSFGGELWNSKSNKVEGILNSTESVAALEFYRDLFRFAPPGLEKHFYNEVNEALQKGTAAMGIQWYYFFGLLGDRTKSPHAEHLAFAPLPGQTGNDGKFRQYNIVGGQGISISEFSTKKEEAWKFLEWFMSRETQWKWVRSGAQTGRTDILKSPGYAKINSYNAYFPVSMSRVKDYWHLVEYPQLLEIYQNYASSAVAGKISAKEALDRTAAEHEALLQKNHR